MTVDLRANTASGGAAAVNTLTSIKNLWGSDHDDHLTGDGTANVLEGGAGADRLDGGGGTDTAAYDGPAQAVTVNLGTNTASGGDAAGDTLANIENLRGSGHPDILVRDGNANEIVGGGGMDSLAGENGNDVLRGEGDEDTLYGGAGADHLSGNADADVLYGDDENDRLTGGAGADTFEFQRAGDSTVGARDVVVDFEAGDVLDLRKLGTDMRVRYQRVDKAGTENDKTLVQVDVNKDGDVEAGEDFEVELSGLHTLGVDDFALTGDTRRWWK